MFKENKKTKKTKNFMKNTQIKITAKAPHIIQKQYFVFIKNSRY